MIGIEALRTQVDLMNNASGISMMPNLAAKSQIVLVLRGVRSARTRRQFLTLKDPCSDTNKGASGGEDGGGWKKRTLER